MRWFSRSKPAGWRYGTIERFIRRGERVGAAVVIDGTGRRHILPPSALHEVWSALPEV